MGSPAFPTAAALVADTEPEAAVPPPLTLPPGATPAGTTPAGATPAGLTPPDELTLDSRVLCDATLDDSQRVVELRAGSVAAAQLQVGDRLVGVDGTALDSNAGNKLPRALARYAGSAGCVASRKRGGSTAASTKEWPVRCSLATRGSWRQLQWQSRSREGAKAASMRLPKKLAAVSGVERWREWYSKWTFVRVRARLYVVPSIVCQY